QARTHPQQLHGPVLFPTLLDRTGATDDRQTPDGIYQPLHRIHRFTIDVAASPATARCPRFYTAAEDGRRQSWADERVWCNPPYSDLARWIEKAWDAEAALVIMLLPANRTEQRWWQRLVEPHRDRGGRLSTRFLPSRWRFVGPPIGGPKGDRPPFGLVPLGWGFAVWPRI